MRPLPQIFTVLVAKHLENFMEIDFFGFMRGLNGLTWERVPELHPQRPKRISTAFSTKSIRAKEPCKPAIPTDLHSSNVHV